MFDFVFHFTEFSYTKFKVIGVELGIHLAHRFGSELFAVYFYRRKRIKRIYFRNYHNQLVSEGAVAAVKLLQIDLSHCGIQGFLKPDFDMTLTLTFLTHFGLFVAHS